MFQKLEKLIFYSLIFSIPFQTRIVLRSWGIGFNEWNSAFLYETDLLIFALLVFWFLRQFTFYDISQNVNSRSKIFFSNYDWFLIVFFIISAISIKNASNQALGFYQLIKLVEFSLLYFYVKSNLGAVFNLVTAFFVFLASGFFQAVLAILQYIRQTDMGLRFLGETVLNPNLFNVATFLVNGEKIMRPYGTTPHPNVLAFFLFLSVFIFIFLYLYYLVGSGKSEKSNLITSKISLILYATLLFGFFLTFSRIIIFVWLVGVISRFIVINKKFPAFAKSPAMKNLWVSTAVILLFFLIIFWPQVLARLDISTSEEAFSLRGFYNKVSLYDKPFFGVGLGNFVNWFKEINPGLASNLYQPVHNIYLLIFSETGILGLAAFLLFLIFLAKDYLSIKFTRPFHYSLFIIFLSLLFFGLFDHYPWTLQQGRIILFLTVGLLAAISPHSSVDRAQVSGA